MSVRKSREEIGMILFQEGEKIGRFGQNYPCFQQIIFDEGGGTNPKMPLTYNRLQTWNLSIPSFRICQADKI